MNSARDAPRIADRTVSDHIAWLALVSFSVTGKNPVCGMAKTAEDESAMDQFREEWGSEYHVKFVLTRCLCLGSGFVLYMAKNIPWRGFYKKSRLQDNHVLPT